MAQHPAGPTSVPISTAWNVERWPTIYLIDEDGAIRAKGHQYDATLVDQLVNEANAPAPPVTK